MERSAQFDALVADFYHLHDLPEDVQATRIRHQLFWGVSESYGKKNHAIDEGARSRNFYNPTRKSNYLSRR